MAETNHILSGLVTINDTDIWDTYGVFLAEERRGGMENLKAIMMPSRMKQHTGVDIREEDGKRYSECLTVANEERDVTLCFALYAASKSEWMQNYADFIQMLKEGDDGWLDLYFADLDLTLHVFFVECSEFKPLTYLWKEGVQASRFKVKFREPEPSF